MAKLTINQILEGLALGAQVAADAGEIVAELDVDEAEIQAGQPATVTAPSIGGSIVGKPGKFSVSVTFTPNV